MSFSDAPCRGAALSTTAALNQLYEPAAPAGLLTNWVSASKHASRPPEATTDQHRLNSRHFYLQVCASHHRVLTATLAWKSAVGTTGMGPPCLPNFLSRLSCTDTGAQRRREKTNQQLLVDQIMEIRKTEEQNIVSFAGHTT